MARIRLLVPTLLLAALSACDSGGGDKDGIPDSIGPINCAGLTGATAESVVTCAGGCGGDFSEAAVDGDLGTYAILQFAAGAGGSLSIRATASDGVNYAAGTPAAVVFGIERDDGNSLNTVQTISTYLDGALQETGNVSTSGSTTGDRDAGRSAIVTTKPFDAIEYTYSQSGGTATVEAQVFEFCTSTN